MDMMSTTPVTTETSRAQLDALAFIEDAAIPPTWNQSPIGPTYIEAIQSSPRVPFRPTASMGMSSRPSRPVSSEMGAGTAAPVRVNVPVENSGGVERQLEAIMNGDFVVTGLCRRQAPLYANIDIIPREEILPATGARLTATLNPRRQEQLRRLAPTWRW